MLLEKLLKEFNFSTNIFNWEEFKLFDQYFERILVSKGTFLIKEGETERYSYFVFDGILRCWWKIQCKLPPKTKRFCPLVLK